MNLESFTPGWKSPLLGKPVKRRRFVPKLKPEREPNEKDILACRGKAAWTSKVKAEADIPGCEFATNRPLTAYLCPVCARWHLARKRR